MTIHICSTAACVGRLTKKEMKDPEIVLAALKQDPRISVWDLEDNRPLQRTIETLVKEGRIVKADTPYPYYGFKVVEVE